MDLSCLEEFKQMIHRAGFSDDMIKRGITLTKTGMDKMKRRFGASDDDIKLMLRALTNSQLNEDERFSYEDDFNGNITVRDSITGDEKYLIGDTAFNLQSRIKKFPNREQDFLRDAMADPLEEDTQSTNRVIKGSLNFPYRGKFATADFGLDNGKPFVDTYSLRDSEDNEADITPELKSSLDAIAMKRVMDQKI